MKEEDMVKRFAGVLALALVLAGCTGTPAVSPAGSTSAPPTGTAVAPTATAAAPTATAAEPTASTAPAESPASGDVTVLLVGFPDQDSIEPTTGQPIPGVGHLRDMFEAAYPAINLNIVNIPWGEGATSYTAKTQSMVQNNEACAYLMPGAYDFGHQGLLEDLGPWADRDQIKSLYLGDSLYAYQGWSPDNPKALLGLPFTGGTRVIHYDSTLFTQWGVEPLSLHPTLQEIHDKAAAMTGKNPVTGEQNYGYWYQGKYINWQFQTIAHAFGANWGKVNDDGSWTITWDTPEYLTALEWLVDMSKYAPPGALAADAMPDGFLTDSNAVAIIPEGETGYYLTAFVGNPALAQRFRTTYNIEGPDGKGGLFSTDPLSMVKTCTNKEAAWTAIKWLTTSKDAQRYNFEQGNIPVIADGEAVVPEVAALPDADPILHQNSIAEARYPWAASQPRWSLQAAIEGALAGTLTPKDALVQAQKETDDWLAAQATE
jgi:ABC-type glycerol-3-phosphate transport system substrate-binding protein